VDPPLIEGLSLNSIVNYSLEINYINYGPVMYHFQAKATLS